MTVSLIETLQQVEDFRSARGKRYPLWVVLLLVILGMMSQCQGYLSLEGFASRHKEALMAALGLSRFAIAFRFNVSSDLARTRLCSAAGGV